MIRIFEGDCREVMATLEEASVDAIVCDPPYDLTAGKKGGSGEASVNLDSPYGRARIGTGNGSGGFMGMKWDGTGVAFDPATWREALRVLKPGGHLLAFGGTRTYHRMVCAIEDAGFEIRDQIGWLYGSGFPKSLDVSKAIDKAQGAVGTFGAPKSAAHAGWIDRGRMRGEEGHEGYQRPWMGDEDAVDRNARQYVGGSEESRQWKGWGTALKPAFEPVVMARKPLAKGNTVASNVLQFGTGALNIDACRVGMTADDREFILKTARPNSAGQEHVGAVMNRPASPTVKVNDLGRWPANVILDGSEEVVSAFPQAPGQQGVVRPDSGPHKTDGIFGTFATNSDATPRGDSGSAARFFYQAAEDAPGRWPANVILDDSEEVQGAFPETGDSKSGGVAGWQKGGYVGGTYDPIARTGYDDSGKAARFFYTAKASAHDRNDGCHTLPDADWTEGAPNSVRPDQINTSSGKLRNARPSKNHHPTVKPTDLMRYLCRLVCPPGGTILDPFMGSGSTLKAAELEGFSAIGIEMDPDYVQIARRRIASDAPLFAEVL